MQDSCETERAGASEGTSAGEWAFELSGGTLCLDFVNTLSWRTGRERTEHLSSYDDLVAWGRQAEIVDAREGDRLLAEATRRPAEAEQVFARAIGLREALFRLFAAIARGQTPGPADLAAVNTALAEAMAHARVVSGRDGFTWGWNEDGNPLDRMLWPVVRSAADLLTTGADLRVLRECEGDGCGWLFVDTTKNRSRRWCNMQDCGNRAKARRHYERKRSARASATP